MVPRFVGARLSALGERGTAESPPPFEKGGIEGGFPRRSRGSGESPLPPFFKGGYGTARFASRVRGRTPTPCDAELVSGVVW